jgi:protein-tyrosine phosphatase
MSETRPQPERIDLSQADDPRDVVHRAVACLAQGGVVGLSTETVYGLAANALNSEAVARLRRLKALDPTSLLTLLLRGSEEVSDWVPDLSALGRRLARRAWPGPVTLMFPDHHDRSLARCLPDDVRRLVCPGDHVALRVPAHPFVREVLRLLPAPLVISKSVGPKGDAAVTAAALAGQEGLNMVVDAGPTRLGQVSTIVRVDPEGWSVVRPGAVDTATLTRMAGTIILFVCTGNTCRSPMAEALCKALLAKRLGCGPGELEARGHVVLSAGVAATHGMPAASHAIEVVRSRGGSLEEHVSRPITRELIRHADVIVAMTNDHLEALLDQVPECAPRARLLHPEGGDVADPVGCDRDTYLRTAHAIEHYLEHLLGELGL